MRDTSLLTKAFIAHRGYHNPTHPENTLGAFKLAIENNFSIELDIQLSKDKEVMVFHDSELKRVTGKTGTIHDYDCSELKSIKILESEETIPTFAEVLSLVDGQVGLVIELKSYGPDNELLAQKAIDILKNYHGSFVVQSFDPTLMSKFKKQAPEFIRGQLVSDFKGEESLSSVKKFLLRNMWTNILSKPDFVNTELHYYPHKMQRMHARGVPIICWTVRSKQDQELANKSFDNIIFEKFDPR